MFISRSHKFVFIHIPKTGGTSILGALAPLGNNWREGWDVKETKGWQYRHHKHRMHSGWHNYSDKLAEHKRQGYFQFAFVRNPWDRMVSIWSKIGRKLDLYRFAMFLRTGENKEFVKSTDRALKIDLPQMKWISLEGKVLVNYLGRYETIELDYDLICKGLKIKDPPKLPHMNKGKHDHYRTYYDDRTRELVADLYQEDIKEFGYEF